MESAQIVSLRTALAYLARGDSRASRVRLGVLIVASYVPWLPWTALAVIVARAVWR